jgi:hypothetical protein
LFLAELFLENKIHCGNRNDCNEKPYEQVNDIHGQ